MSATYLITSCPLSTKVLIIPAVITMNEPYMSSRHCGQNITFADNIDDNDNNTGYIWTILRIVSHEIKIIAKKKKQIRLLFKCKIVT